MTALGAAWLGVLALHIVWLAMFRNVSGRLVAALGAVLAVGLFVAAHRAAPLLQESWPATLNRPRWAVLFVSIFLLPVLTLAGSLQVAFLRLNGRAWLILAWIVATALVCMLRAFERPGPASGARSVSPLVVLFILWTSMFWLSAIWDLGVGRAVVELQRGPSGCQFDRLATVFSIWETYSPREHLFLGWWSLADFKAHQAYANHVHPYLLTIYGWTWALRSFAGAPLHVAVNSTPFLSILVMIAGVTTLLARSGLLRGRDRPLGLMTLFIAMGFVVTTWRFWVDAFRFNTDNPYPLVASVLVFVYAGLLPPVRPRLVMLAAVIFVALSPIHMPMLILAMACLFGHGAASPRGVLDRNRVVLNASLAALVAAVLTQLAPRLLIEWKGYALTASSFTFRSGLDGDTRYFTSLAQAALAPCPLACCYLRSAADLLLPGLALLCAVAPLTLFDRGATSVSLSRQLLFLATPYLVSLILFPQSVSIHPYLYDHLLMVPIVVTGATALLTDAVQGRLKGAGLLVLLLLMGGLIMSNLIAIAQEMAIIVR